MTTLADLIAEVAAEHEEREWQVDETARYCYCGADWTDKGCSSRAARLAAAFSVENVAAGLRAEGAVWQMAKRYGKFNDAYYDKFAAALLAAITVVG